MKLTLALGLVGVLTICAVHAADAPAEHDYYCQAKRSGQFNTSYVWFGPGNPVYRVAATSEDDAKKKAQEEADRLALKDVTIECRKA